MKISLWMPITHELGIVSIRQRDIAWPPSLGLPSPGDIVNLIESDGETYSYDVKRVNYYPGQDARLNFAVIEIPHYEIAVKDDLIEILRGMEEDGWYEMMDGRDGTHRS